MREDVVCNVLVAEDNLITQNLLGSMLRNWGYLVTIVNDGLEAIEQMKIQLFDLVIMDHQMPNMNGLETIEVLQQNLFFKSEPIPVIFLTGEINIHVLAQIEKCGVKYILKKPFQPNELSQMVNHVLQDNPTLPNTGIAPTKYLKRITNANNYLMLEIIDVFLEETPRNFRRLKTYCLLKDWQNIKKLLHKIKANHFYVGIAENEKLIHELEMDLERMISSHSYMARILLLEKNTTRAMVGLNKKRKILLERIQK